MKHNNYFNNLIKAIFFLTFLSGCSATELATIQETDKVFKKPESITYDPIEGILYVSNINGSPQKKDGNGLISRMRTDGTIESINWLGGLDAPKGIVVHNRNLYFTDINRIHIVNIEKKEKVKTIEIPDSKFLNDIVVTTDNIIFVSDTKKNCVFKISEDNQISTLNGKYKGANGLFLKDNFLYIGTSSDIHKYDTLNSKSVIIYPNTGNVDGLYVFSDTHFLISNFTHKIVEIKDNQETVIFKGTPFLDCCADFYFDKKSRLMFIPTFNRNTVKYLTVPE